MLVCEKSAVAKKVVFSQPMLLVENGRLIETGVLIRYYFDYERARIWRSGALETSRHDQSVQQPCQEFGGATWAGSVLRRVAPDQTEVRANSYAVGRSCRRPERAPRVASSGCDPYRSSRFCAPEAPRPGAG